MSPDFESLRLTAMSLLGVGKRKSEPREERRKLPHLTISRDGNEGEIDLTSDVVISRNGRFYKYQEGEKNMPIRVDEGMTFISLDDNRVSHMHCFIRVENNGQAHLIDLDSMNGTYVEGKKVKKADLSPGNRIQVGPYLLTYGIREENPNYTRKHAVLIGTKGKSNKDVDTIQRILFRRGFRDTDIETLIGRNAKPRNVKRALERAKYNAGRQGLFVFYYSGYATNSYALPLYHNPFLSLLRQDDITPRDLCTTLGTMSGHKVAILDASFGDGYKEAYETHVSPDTLIIPSSRESCNGIAGVVEYSPGETSPLTDALSRILNARTCFLNLKDLGADVNAIMKAQDAGREGYSHTMIGQTMIF